MTTQQIADMVLTFGGCIFVVVGLIALCFGNWERTRPAKPFQAGKMGTSGGDDLSWFTTEEKENMGK